MSAAASCFYFDTLNGENVAVPQSSPLCPATGHLFAATKKLRMIVIISFIISLILSAMCIATYIMTPNNLSLTSMVLALFMLLLLTFVLVFSSKKKLEGAYLKYAS